MFNIPKQEEGAEKPKSLFGSLKESTGSSLFGNTNGKSLFGNTDRKTTSLFGNTAPGTSLFGSKPAEGGLFGAKPSGSLFASNTSLFGAQTSIFTKEGEKKEGTNDGNEDELYKNDEEHPSVVLEDTQVQKSPFTKVLEKEVPKFK